MNCVTCKANCISAGQHRVNTDCISYVPKDYPKPITNADRIRAMKDNELAYLFDTFEDWTFEPDYEVDSYSIWLEWLNQEAKKCANCGELSITGLEVCPNCNAKMEVDE